MQNFDPAYQVQAAVFAALTASPALIAVFAALTTNAGAPRIYDGVPLDPTGSVDTALFAYLTIGDDQVIGETPFPEGTEIFVKVEAWSRATDQGEVKQLAGAVRETLDAVIPMTLHRVVTHKFHGTLYRREPDGLTRRAIITQRYQTTPLGS